MSYAMQGNIYAATITATPSGGEWSSGSTWVGGIVPQSGDVIIIPSSSTISITFNIVNLRGPNSTIVNLYGTIAFIVGGIRIDSGDGDVINVFTGGQLYPFPRVNLYFDNDGIFSPTISTTSSLPGPLSIEDGSSAPLPIVLSFFKAKQQVESVVISWQSATELNNDYYTIERSRDGQVYEAIAKIPGKGTTNDPQDYKFLDQKPYLGISYYRLKQTDYDGTSETFNPVVVQFAPDLDRMVIAPNPVTDGEFALQLTGLDADQDVVITISNMKGQRVFEKEINTAQNNFLDQEIRLNDGMPRGVYFLTVHSGATVQTAKLMVKR